MVPENEDRNKTAYTVTVDYRHGKVFSYICLNAKRSSSRFGIFSQLHRFHWVYVCLTGVQERRQGFLRTTVRSRSGSSFRHLHTLATFRGRGIWYPYALARVVCWRGEGTRRQVWICVD